MAELIFIHDNMSDSGGEESVVMHMIDAVQGDHEVTLISGSSVPVSEYNDQFGTAVSGIKLIEISELSAAYRNVRLYAKKITSGRLGVLRPLQLTAFHQIARKYTGDPDLVISSQGEMGRGYADIAYVHYPKFCRTQNTDRSINGSYIKLIDNLVTKVSGVEEFGMTECVIANSEWTKGILADIYDCDVTVLHPPIRINEFHPVPPPSEREQGFITLGRLSPEKRQLMAIELVSKLRDRGHDTHIHIAGPQGDSKYSDRILAQADRCSFIHYEGKLPRKEYIDLIRSHRYGIHAMPNEHFGITIAEMVAGGCVPIVPNDGGQTEIVNNNENLLYADFDEAIERLDTLLSSPALEQDLRDELTAYPYRVERFKNKFNKIIDRRLSDQNSSVLARSN